MQEKNKGGRPLEFPIRKIIAINESMADEIEEFRARQKPIPNHSEAIRMLIRKALDNDTEKT